VHYPPAIAVGQPELWSLLLLAHGVTSIRETGSIDDRIFETSAAIEAVMVDGRLYTRAEIDSMLASFDAHFHGAVYAGVMDTVVSVVRDGFAPEQSSSHDHGGTP
jgi:hypothetical protein